MEIVQVAGLYPPHLGGQELVVQTLARVQAAAGHRVTVLTSSIGGEAGDTEEHGVRVWRLRTWALASTPVMPRLPVVLLAHSPRPDVVHLHTGHALVAEQVMLACRVRRIPYVVHVHLLVRPSSRVGRALLPLYRRTLFGWFLRHAAQVICLTQAMRRELIRAHRLDPDKVRVVPNGTDAPLGGADVRRSDEVLFVGRLTAQKNILGLVEAMALLPDVTLRVLGDGDQHDEVRERIRALGLANVVLEGRADRQAVAAAYRRATVLAMPSTHEGMPLVLLEAMAAGLPVVASNIEEIEEVVGDAGVLIPDTQPNTIARVLRSVISDPDEQRRLRDAGLALASRHTWAAVAEQVEDVYRAASLSIPVAS